jgi:5-methylcytosine-specific restriction endonuclease McrA
VTSAQQAPLAAEPSEKVGYVPGNATNNAVLLAVLRPLWNYRCYWCNEPVSFRHMAVDHIIPRTVTAQRLTELKTHFGLPADFGVHRPGNLAPICTPCNTKKSSSDYGHLPVLLDHLQRAATVAPKVIKQVQRFATLNELGPALL